MGNCIVYILTNVNVSQEVLTRVGGIVVGEGAIAPYSHHKKTVLTRSTVFGKLTN